MSDIARKILSAFIAEGYTQNEAITLTIKSLTEFGGRTLPQAWDEVFGEGGWHKMKLQAHAILTGATP